MQKRKSEIPERVIAKGKKKEVLSDKIVEIGEEVFDFIIDRWKEIGLGVIAILIVGFAIWIFSEQKKKKLSEELARFERALLLVASYDMTQDMEKLKEAEKILSEIKENPKFIPKLYIAWIKSKEGDGKKAVEILNSVINSEAPPEVKKIARIMKIHISKNCNEILQTWEEIKGEGKQNTPEDILILNKEEEQKRVILSIPLRTYFEVAKCADGKPEILRSISSELEILYSIERFASEDKAKNILMVKKFVENKLRKINKK